MCRRVSIQSQPLKTTSIHFGGSRGPHVRCKVRKIIYMHKGHKANRKGLAMPLSMPNTQK